VETDFGGLFSVNVYVVGLNFNRQKRNPLLLQCVTLPNDKLVVNRHRGDGHPSSPATPPDMRVRIRRFGGLSYVPANKRGTPSESK